MENRHTSDDLKMLQALPLDIKIRKTELRIQEFYEHFNGQVYVSNSGGKDSAVLSHIVKRLYPDVQNVFINTGLEDSSVLKIGIKQAQVVLKPKMDFVSIITKYGYPVLSKEVCDLVAGANGNNTRMQRLNNELIDPNTGKLSKFNSPKHKYLLDAPFKLSGKCCDVMKKAPAHDFCVETGKYPLLGLMAEESLKRRRGWIKTGCNAFEKKNPQSQPLSFWTEQDILQYIKQNNIEIASAYGDVVYKDDDGMEYDNDVFNTGMKLVTTEDDRTGCTFCLFGIVQCPERLLRLKERDPQRYDYVMRGGKFDENGMWIPDGGLGYKFVIDWLNEHGNLNIKY